MDDHIISLLISLISAVLAPFIVARLGGGAGGVSQRLSVHGDHNRVEQTLNHTTNEVRIHYQQLPDHEKRRGPTRQDSADDSDARAIGAVMALVAFVLAYLFAWPVLVWAFAGAAVGLAASASLAASATRGTPGPRWSATLATTISCGVLLLSAWWTRQGGPGSSVNGADIEASIAQRYPRYDDGLTARFDVITTHWLEILTLLGVPGAIYAALQVLAVAAAALMVWQRAGEQSGWLALHNLPRDPTNRKLIARAARFKSLGAGTVVVTILCGAIICGITGGWAHTLLQSLQAHGLGSLTSITDGSSTRR